MQGASSLACAEPATSTAIAARSVATKESAKTTRLNNGLLPATISCCCPIMCFLFFMLVSLSFKPVLLIRRGFYV